VRLDSPEYLAAEAALAQARAALSIANTHLNRLAFNAAWAAREAVAPRQKRSGYASRAGKRQARERGTR